ncbi:MAG: hypothetical protein Kow0025_03920 [Thermodesulfovibrionales bacterium]
MKIFPGKAGLSAALALAALLLFAPRAMAEKAYVSDDLTITMRSGQGNEFRIIKILKTGTPLEVLQREERYAQVRTADGEEGWVLSQYLTSETPKSLIIDGLRGEVSRLKARVEEARAETDAVRAELNSIKKTHSEALGEVRQAAALSQREASQTARELEDISSKYQSLLEASKDVAGLVAERNRLEEENARLTAIESHLKDENQRVKRKVMIYWFLAGAGVFFVGWIVGKASRQRRFY